MLSPLRSAIAETKIALAMTASASHGGGNPLKGELCDHFRKLDRCTVMQHLGVPIKELHDRWISGYATGTVDLLARMKREIEE